MSTPKTRSTKSASVIADRVFKLTVLLGVPILGVLYFSQHALKTAPDLKPFQVVKAPSLEGITSGPSTAAGALSWQDKPITVVNFWATWCPPCIEEMPGMAELAGRFDGKGTRFVFVSVDDDWSKVQKFLHDNVIDLPAGSLFLDADKSVASRWGSAKFPETYIVNRDGWIVEKIVGFQEWTRPLVVQYFEKLSQKYSASSALNWILPSAYADSTTPMIHEDDKRNLEKMKKNVDTAGKNVSKLEAALKDENRSLRELNVKIDRGQKDIDDLSAEMKKNHDALTDVSRVKKKNEDALASEKRESDKIKSDLEALQEKVKKLEKELQNTRDEIVVTTQKSSSHLQNIESYQKAIESSKDENKKLADRDSKMAKELDRRNSDLRDLKKDLDKRQAKISSLDSDLKDWNETLEKEKSKLVEFEKILEK